MQFFELIKESNDSQARAGILRTSHGDISTPIFMPVGTQGTVKAMEHKSLLEYDAKVILGNTYHLYLRPGLEILSSFGGLHKFMNWKRPILTDSGGYQVFSLQELRKLTPDGVEFRSHIDGSKHFFSSEKVVDIQRVIGSDIMMILDECAPYPSTFEYTSKSVDLSLKWAIRSHNYFQFTDPLYGNKQFQFAICQGGMFPELRRKFINEAIQHDFDGFSIGGLSVGEPAEIMYEMTSISTELLPKDKPRYLMGVGTPENILESIERGIDMFDCVLPTRNARNGQIFTTRGKINLRNAKHKYSNEPIDPGFDYSDDMDFTLGYLRHLFVSGEILALILATRQNIRFYLWLAKTAREKIIAGEFVHWKKDFLEKYSQII